MLDMKRAELLAKLEKFSIDQGEPAFTFADRLAKENGWQHAYAARVIVEYKRFIFLAMTADHSVSPPDAVDQAWHLHLLYTRSYWDRLCGEVLHRPLHHGPTLGGAAEQTKHNDWYERTLASYRTLLELEPPADIWPSPTAIQRKQTKFQRVDRQRFWLLPKFGWKGSRAMVPVAAASFAAIPLAAVINPFDMPGKQFLMLFGAMFVVALLLGWVMRRFFASSERDAIDGKPLDPLELALLNGGQLQMMQAIVAGLIHEGTLVVRQTKTGLMGMVQETRLHAEGPLPLQASKLETLIYEEAKAKQGIKVQDLPAVITPTAERMREELERRELLTGREWTLSCVLPGVPMLLVFFIGVAKMGLGIWREKPIGFLIFGCIVALITGLLLMQRPRLTASGKATLKKWKQQSTHLRSSAKAGQLTPADMMLSVAMFGIVATTPGPLTTFAKVTGPGNTSTSCGSSCSGGSSCGGGGCGGGGCGGCGGGGD